jgi:uracil-DNA glycosylase
VDGERRAHTVYPPEDEVFAALELTPYERVKVMILGQDPYHGPGQAHGLAFSVRPGVAPPPSLRNIFRELRDELGCPPPRDGSLVPWARQGVLLLNAVLTVRAGEPNSHQGKGWETFTDAVIRAVNERPGRVVFVLWGGYAAKKEALIDAGRHAVLRSAHPSPLSAKRGFFGSRPFTKVNAALEDGGQAPVDWCLRERERQGGDA